MENKLLLWDKFRLMVKDFVTVGCRIYEGDTPYLGMTLLDKLNVCINI